MNAAGLPEVPAKAIVHRTKDTSWFGTEYTMNLYRGCCHGCIYCDSRSDCYHVEPFDQVCIKADALETVRKDLRRKIRSGVVGTGAMSDPYNPFEKQLKLTRHSLELLSAYGFGAAIATKGTLIVQDTDILQEISSLSPVICKITVTTADDTLAAKLEPGAPSSTARLRALEELRKQGIYAGLLLMPILPFLEDTPDSVRELVRRAADAGACFLYAAFGVTMRPGQREWMYSKLDALFPGQNLPERYRRTFGDRYRCPSPRAGRLWEIFEEECSRRGILYRMEEIVRSYKMGYENSQLQFFE